MARATRKTKFIMNGKVSTIETPIFGSTGHTHYSGYGVHQDHKRSERRQNRNEARDVKKGRYE